MQMQTAAPAKNTNAHAHTHTQGWGRGEAVGLKILKDSSNSQISGGEIGQKKPSDGQAGEALP